jgi:hypothetical protein
MARDESSDDGYRMPVRTIENSEALIRTWVRWLLVCLLLPTVVIASLVELLAVLRAPSGYWGPNWPTAGRDTVGMSAI